MSTEATAPRVTPAGFLVNGIKSTAFEALALIAIVGWCIPFLLLTNDQLNAFNSEPYRFMAPLAFALSITCLGRSVARVLTRLRRRAFEFTIFALAFVFLHVSAWTIWATFNMEQITWLLNHPTQIYVLSVIACVFVLIESTIAAYYAERYRHLSDVAFRIFYKIPLADKDRLKQAYKRFLKSREARKQRFRYLLT